MFTDLFPSSFQCRLWSQPIRAGKAVVLFAPANESKCTMLPRVSANEYPELASVEHVLQGGSFVLFWFNFLLFILGSREQFDPKCLT